jgi:hypothetical protein
LFIQSMISYLLLGSQMPYAVVYAPLEGTVRLKLDVTERSLLSFLPMRWVALGFVRPKRCRPGSVNPRSAGNGLAPPSRRPRRSSDSRPRTFGVV